MSFFAPEDAFPVLEEMQEARERQELLRHYQTVSRTYAGKGIISCWSSFEEFESWSEKAGFKSGMILSCIWGKEIEGYQVIRDFARPEDAEDYRRRNGHYPTKDIGLIEVDGAKATVRYWWWDKPENIVRRQKMPLLTAESRKILKGRRKTTHGLISAFGRTLSAAQWQHQPEAAVSDKTITARINQQWTAEAAISTAPKHK